MPTSSPKPPTAAFGEFTQALALPQANLWNAVAVGFKEIWAHKFRSALTMLGIFLGVSSLIAFSAMVKGMENGMRESLIAIGGLETVRIEMTALPAAQQHLADQAKIGRASCRERGEVSGAAV